jgi:influenza virus NS1A-binding protein
MQSVATEVQKSILTSLNIYSNCLNTAERFDPATGKWEMLPNLNESRRALALVALPDGIYAIGGYNGQ